MTWEHRSADLRVEADGLESRVVNLRAVLLQLDEQRRSLHVEEGRTSKAPKPASSNENCANDIAIKQREMELVRISEELASQQFDLQEQVDRLAVAREAWRSEESRIVEELAQLAEQVRRREDRVAENEKAIGFDQECLDRDRAALKLLGERAEAWQARQEAVEATWHSEFGVTGCRSAAARAKSRTSGKRLGGAMPSLERTPPAGSRSPAHRTPTLRENAGSKWAAQQTILSEREHTVEQQQHSLETQALLVEKARQKLLQSIENPLLAEKRVERLSRRLHSSLAKTEARIEKQRQAILAEREELGERVSTPWRRRKNP